MSFRDFAFGVLTTSTILFLCIICNKIPNVRIGDGALPNINVTIPPNGAEMITDGKTVPKEQWLK